jgi:hypothetical protein
MVTKGFLAKPFPHWQSIGAYSYNSGMERKNYAIKNTFITKGANRIFGMFMK